MYANQLNQVMAGGETQASRRRQGAYVGFKRPIERCSYEISKAHDGGGVLPCIDRVENIESAPS